MSRMGEYILSEEGELTILNERLNDDIIVTLLKTNTDDELAEIFPSILDRARLRAFYFPIEQKSTEKESGVKRAAQALCDLQQGGGGGGGGAAQTQQKTNIMINKEFSCKYCGKSLKSHYAVRYHEDNNVCAKNPLSSSYPYIGTKKLRLKKRSALFSTSSSHHDDSIITTSAPPHHNIGIISSSTAITTSADDGDGGSSVNGEESS